MIKKYKSALLFLTACLIMTGFILLINANLSKILPDYKNQPGEFEHTIAAEETTSDSGETDDIKKPLTVSQACRFYSDNMGFIQEEEAADRAVYRAEEAIPQLAKSITSASMYNLTVFSSVYKNLDEQRYYNITFDAREGDHAFQYILIYSEDGTEIYFYNNRTENIFQYAIEVSDSETKSTLTENCRNIITASGAGMEFQPDEFWDSRRISNVHTSSNKMTNYYLLRDNTHKITLEYNLEDNQILSFSIGK